jgi:hypothetical protein
MMRPRAVTFLWHLAVSLLMACVWLIPADADAQTLRVVSWNLGTNSALDKAGALLKKERPDIILLQQIPDWKFCRKLADTLKPVEYHVLVCSAWSQSGGQTAILSREKAYFSWHETWRGSSSPELEGGCAFATVYISGRRIGLFSVQLGDEWPISEPDLTSTLNRRRGALDQVLKQVKSISGWVTNRPEYFVIGGTFNSSLETSKTLHSNLVSQLDEAGFGDLSATLPEDSRLTRRLPRGTADYVFTRPAGLGQALRVLSANLAAHEPVVCELDLSPAKQIVARPASPGKGKTPPQESDATLLASKAPVLSSNTSLVNSAASLGAAMPAPTPNTLSISSSLNPWWIALGLGFLLVVCVWLLFARWREPRHLPALLPDARASSGSPTYVIVTPSSVTGTHTGVPGASLDFQPLVHIDSPESGPTHSETWRNRALLAEQQAEAAKKSLRAGLRPQLAKWLKQKFVRKMLTDRAAMIETQNAAALQAAAVDRRLARIEEQIQDQNAAYEIRIAELTAELNAARAENRELIRARIVQVKAEMLKARERLMAEKEQAGEKPNA